MIARSLVRRQLAPQDDTSVGDSNLDQIIVGGRPTADT
jgi:hypothetical protein